MAAAILDLPEPRPRIAHNCWTLRAGGSRLPAMDSKARRSALFNSMPKAALRVTSHVAQVSGLPSAAPRSCGSCKAASILIDLMPPPRPGWRRYTLRGWA